MEDADASNNYSPYTDHTHTFVIAENEKKCRQS